MRSQLSVFVAILVLSGVAGCTEAATNRTDRAEDFADFARALFVELESRPLNPAQHIGLFGDLDVLSGENIVMGRYRYRTDSTAGASTAHMAFHVREGEMNPAVPVVLTFAPDNGRWELTDARVVGDEPADDSLSVLLHERLDSWVTAAAENTQY